MSQDWSHGQDGQTVAGLADSVDDALLAQVVAAAPAVADLPAAAQEAMWQDVQARLLNDSVTAQRAVQASRVRQIFPDAARGRTVLALAACSAALTVGVVAWNAVSAHRGATAQADGRSQVSAPRGASESAKAQISTGEQTSTLTSATGLSLATGTSIADRQMNVTPRSVLELKGLARADTYVVACNPVRPIQLCGPKFSFGQKVAVGVTGQADNHLVGMTLTVNSPIAAGDGDTPGTQLWLVSAVFDNPGWPELATAQLSSTPHIRHFAALASGTVGGESGFSAPECEVLNDGWMVETGHQVDMADSWVRLPVDGVATYSATVACDASASTIGGPYMLLSWATADGRGEAVFSGADPDPVYNLGTRAGK